MNNYTRDNLDKLGIYELRTLAREVGVYSPTTLKKNELMDQILNIVSGKEKPYVNVERRGRPPKEISRMGEIKQIFNIKDDKVQYATKSKLNICDGTFNQISSNLGHNQKKMCGYFKPFSDTEGYILNLKNNLFTIQSVISAQIIEDYDLREGDYLCYTCSYCNEIKDITKVDDIISINKVSYTTKPKRINFADLPYEYSTKRIDLTAIDSGRVNYKVLDRISPLFLGARLIINNEHNNFKIDRVASILDKLCDYNVETSVMCIGERPEEVQNFVNILPNADVIYKKQNQSAESFRDEFVLKFQHLLRQVEDGKNVALVLNDFNRAKKFIASYIALNKFLEEDEALVKSDEILCDYFKCGKITNNAGSLTLIVMNCKSKEMLKICNTYWFLNDKPYEGTDIVVDLQNCYCDFVNEYNYYDEYLEIKTFKEKLKHKSAMQCLQELFE